MSELMKGQAGIRIVVANGEMLVYHDLGGELLYQRPIYEGEWEELWDFIIPEDEGGEEE
jgi:hypothetical protein